MEADLLIALLVFLGRVADVSLGTMRMILTVSGARWWSALLGFFELLIWVLAVGGVVTNLDSPVILVAYAGGFAAGTLVGISIEDRIALGYRTLTIINNDPSASVAAAMREGGFPATKLEGSGRDSDVEVLVAVIRRRSLRQVRELVQETAPRAFISVERADRPIGAGSSDIPSLPRRGSLRGLVRK